MRIAVLSAEAVAYSKTGGLGDVAGALPKALRSVGQDAFLITPCYWQTKGEYLWHTAFDDLPVDWRAASITRRHFIRGQRFADVSDRRAFVFPPRFDLWIFRKTTSGSPFSITPRSR
ncbi:MAG: glycogen/starch synthase [Acidobacteria bacterium]|nr:glycogen/starch synthase [Acidobacteriota bacterium]